MIVRKLEDIINTEYDVQAETWYSRRLLLKKDGMGFSMHETVLKAGTSTEMHYKHHVEAVYCIEGEGEVEVIGGERYAVRPGTLYALNLHDHHIFHAHTDVKTVCVFNPPVTGTEKHGPDGAYPPSE